ncbi:MAG: two-component system sensor histidine kinase RegB [Pseudohongiellaceae bacterium]|jgi:two-component system sensor histidine kinase RegB
MSSKTLSLTPSATNLLRLNIIRMIVLCGIGIALAYIHLQGQQDLRQYFSHSLIACLYTLIALFTQYRIRLSWPVTDAEYFLHLFTDVSIISALLFFSGGASNPFVSYFLVPLCISAAILPWRYTWVIAGYSLTAYSLMLFYFEPLPTTVINHQHHSSSSFNQHVLGMWFNFALSAGLITYFVVKMANSLRQKEALWVTEKEDRLRDEQIFAVATLAAGTAHELSTPLSTMTILLEELKAEHDDIAPLKKDLTLLQEQVNRCSVILKNLVNTAESHNQKQQEDVIFTAYIEQLLEHWQVIRPSTHFSFTKNVGLAPSFSVDPTLEQAIFNLLNNAADASSQNIAIHLDWNKKNIQLSIHDQGPGIPIDIAEQLGKPFISNKGSGLGLGLFLSHATVQRYGGSIELHNHPEGGSVAELTLPFIKPAK